MGVAGAWLRRSLNIAGVGSQTGLAIAPAAAQTKGNSPVLAPRAWTLNGSDEYISEGRLVTGAPTASQLQISEGFGAKFVGTGTQRPLGSSVIFAGALTGCTLFNGNDILYYRALGDGNSQAFFNFNDAFTIGDAVRLAFTSDGTVATTVSAYLNGVLIDTDTSSTSSNAFAPDEDQWVGRLNTQYTNGTMWCRWRVTGVVLNAAELAEVDAFIAAEDYTGESSGLLTYLQGKGNEARILTALEDGTVVRYGAGLEPVTVNIDASNVVAIPAVA